jgi:diphosphomevalonate decarboxylase
LQAAAIGHPNFALAKYWGKQQVPGNYPAVPSLSLTVAALSTRTEVVFESDLAADEFVLNGTTADARRVSTLLDRVRAAAGLTAAAHVRSANDFPTASGLASSAAGFATLALAAVRAARLDWDLARVSDLARRSSASAARSVFSGYVELEAPDISTDAFLPASQVAPPDQLDIRLIVCVTAEGAKATGSTAGMTRTAMESPYYPAWLELAPRVFRDIRAAVLERDLPKLGELAERSAFAMHGCAFGAGIGYANAGTLETLARVRELRAAGTGAWATMDAGPHVKVLVRAADASAVQAILAQVPGVLRTIVAEPGPGATIVSDAGAGATIVAGRERG